MRSITTMLGVLTLLLLAGRGAWGHGGMFIPPPEAPGGRQPLKRPRSNTPTAVTPGTGGPIVTPGGSGFMKPGLVGRRKSREITPTYETSWHPWWRMRERLWMPAPRTALLTAVTPSEGEAAERTPWSKRRDALVREKVLAFLRHAVDPTSKCKPDVQASALIALAKVTPDDTDVPRMLDRLVDPKAPEIVRESAALALGLLRRTDLDHQLAAFRIDGIRGQLLQVFDGRAGNERIEVTRRIKQFAALAIGLLGDQPFSNDPRSKDGRLISQLLWQRLETIPFRTHEEPIALLHALSLQPSAGISTAIHRGLRDIADGKKISGRRFHARVRAHALTALIRLGSSSERAYLIRLLGGERTPFEVKTAAIVALGSEAERMASVERVVAARVLETALRDKNQELLTAGLLNLSLGEVLGADLRDGSERVLRALKNGALLESRARSMPWHLQGFAALALGTALRDVRPPDADGTVAAFRTRSAGTLRLLLGNSKKEQDVRAAAAVALGLIGDPDSIAPLTAVVRNPKRTGDFRGYAALATALIGLERAKVVEALEAAATSPGPEVLRARAAMAISVFGERATAEKLIRELERGGGTRRLAGVTKALGRLGELDAAGPLMAAASDPERNELVQAMAIAALGILLDPESVPSLMRLMNGAVYPLRTPVMEEVFTLL